MLWLRDGAQVGAGGGSDCGAMVGHSIFSPARADSRHRPRCTHANGCVAKPQAPSYVTISAPSCLLAAEHPAHPAHLAYSSYPRKAIRFVTGLSLVSPSDMPYKTLHRLQARTPPTLSLPPFYILAHVPPAPRHRADPIRSTPTSPLLPLVSYSHHPHHSWTHRYASSAPHFDTQVSKTLSRRL